MFFRIPERARAGDNRVRRTVAGRLVLVLALLLAGCQAQVGEPTPEDAAAVCLRGGPFVADGAIPLESTQPGNVHEVRGLRWEAHEGCERFVIDLAGEDDRPAASAGDVRAEVLRDLGVVRISLRDVAWVDPDATDAVFDGSLARAAYVVRSDEGRWVYVDLHLAGEAEAHVALLEKPGRVVVDLRPGGGEIPPEAVIDGLVVVLQPMPGAASYPLMVTGYARTFEANVVARVEQNGEEIEETFTTATSWIDAWGQYRLTIEAGPSGPTELHVGEYSAKDGTWQGALVELDMQ